MRIEDLDVDAARPEHYESQPADLLALGIDWDGEVVRQSTRRPGHDAAIASLVDRGLAYECYCSRREVREAASAPHGPPGSYPGTCRRLTRSQRAERAGAGRRPALRLLAGDVEVTVVDRLHGRYTGVVDDFVIRRNDGTPAYNLAVVVDDAAQRIEEVVRGDDLLASSPRQAHLATLLGLSVPMYAHVPLVVATDGERLAKRDASVTLEGVDPAAARSMLAASLGLGRDGEPVTVDDLLARFDPGALPREPWVLR